MLIRTSLRFKIAVSIIVYITVIGIAGNLFLYFHLQEAVFRKTERLDHDQEESVRIQLEQNFANVFSLAVICATDPAVLQLVSRQDRTQYEVILDSLNIQRQINAFLRVNPVNPYINKLILFSNEGLFVQAMGRQAGSPADADNIRMLPLYTRFIEENLLSISGFSRSIYEFGIRDSYVLLLRIRGAYRNDAEAYLYVETGLDMIINILQKTGGTQGMFVQVPETGEIILRDRFRFEQPAEGEWGYVPEDVEFPYRFKLNTGDIRKYRLDRIPLQNGKLILYNQVDITSFAVDDRRILYTVVATVIVSLCAAIGLVLSLTAFFSRPIHVLIGKIRKISEENDLSYDPEIEKSKDEIGQIGKAINEMAGSIEDFLIKMEKQYQEQKNAEIALLQTQINPHFIYNTLDSIQWMAKIQNNPSIVDITRRLTNLLRNSAAGMHSDSAYTKITMEEELSLLDDYVEIMSLRFMGSFEAVYHISDSALQCLIPRLTLQPLVENAIRHGIQPGKFGVITISASCENGFLTIIVEDNGAGMSEEQLETLKTHKHRDKKNSASLHSMGVANVDERLKLLYGESCGLFFESSLGEYTRVRVKIAEER